MHKPCSLITTPKHAAMHQAPKREEMLLCSVSGLGLSKRLRYRVGTLAACACAMLWCACVRLVSLLACLQCACSVTLSQHGEQLAFPLDPERAADHLIALPSFAEAALRCTATV